MVNAPSKIDRNDENNTLKAACQPEIETMVHHKKIERKMLYKEASLEHNEYVSTGSSLKSRKFILAGHKKER